MKNLLITIIGNVASGKTTITSLISKHLPAKKIPADELFRVNPFFPLAVKDRKRWSLASDLWFLYRRVEMTNEFSLGLRKTYILVDGGLPMSYVYAYSRLRSGFYTKDEWKLYTTYYKSLCKNILRSDLIISLEASVDFLQSRIRKRGRAYEIKYFTDGYLLDLNKSLNSFKQNSKKTNTKLLSLNVEKLDLLYNRPTLQSILKKIQANGRRAGPSSG